MKKIYIECNMGVAGDMLCGALLDTLNDNEKEVIISKLNTLMDGVTVSCKKCNKLGITGTKFDVEIEKRGHHHINIQEIYDIIDSFDLNDKVKSNAKNVYTLIAKAESKVHGTDVADIHLHEVGMKDAIMDVTAFCYIANYLNIDSFSVSTINTGFGEVNTAHGILPVPAPATAHLLAGLPTKQGDIKGELTTPTGAGLVKYFATETTNTLPSYDKIGYGMGTKDFEKPNCVRIFIDESSKEDITELRCQIDDMTGEETGYAINKMISLGAKDCFVNPITMKKSRPAFEFVVITSPDKKDYFIEQIFKHTTTIGIREIICKRAVLTRESYEKNGVSIKKSTGYNTTKEKIEFEDLAKIADEKDISIFQARKEIEKKL